MNCNAITKKGTNCKVLTTNSNGFCIYHQKNKIEGITCSTITQKGNLCSMKVENKGDFCKFHKERNEEDYCKAIKSNGERCKLLFDSEDGFCIWHRVSDVVMEDDNSSCVIRFFNPKIDKELSYNEIKSIFNIFVEINCDAKMYNLKDVKINKNIPGKVPDAYLLLIKDGVSLFYNKDELFEEQKSLPKDTKVYIRNNLVSRISKHVLSFEEESKDPEYTLGIKKVLAFSESPILESFKNKIHHVLGENGQGCDLKAKADYYFDNSECGTYFHGEDKEFLFCIKLGNESILRYRWSCDCEQVTDNIDFRIEHGDIFIMFGKSTGDKYRQSNKLTLEFAEGCEGKKYLN